MTISPSRRVRLGTLIAVAALALAGCTAGSTPASDAPTGSAGPAVSITDAWVKSAASGMSAGFGELRNDSDADITIVSASSEAASTLEFHETVQSDSGETVMRRIEDDIVIPANDALTLAPGGNHIMIMGLAAPLAAGEEVTITLTFADDTTYAFTAPVKDYAGANENYVGDDMDSGR